jgi:hypothetical protein
MVLPRGNPYRQLTDLPYHFLPYQRQLDFARRPSRGANFSKHLAEYGKAEKSADLQHIYTTRLR